jgi:hypothetical protein
MSTPKFLYTALIALCLPLNAAVVPTAFWRAFYQPSTIFGAGTDGNLTLTGAGSPSSCGPNNPCLLNGSLINAVMTYLTANASQGNTSVSVQSTSGFVSGRRVLIIQMEGAGAGTFEVLAISSVSGSSLTFTTPLRNAYSAGSKTQVIFLREYNNLTLNSGATLSVPAYNTSTGVGGVIALMVNGTLTINNNGGSGVPGTISVGGGSGTTPSPRGFPATFGPGAGSGAAGGQNTSPGDPTRVVMGSGSQAAAGGGAILLFARNLVMNGQIMARGGNSGVSGQGGGAGGTVLIVTESLSTSATCGTLSATGGTGNSGGANGGDGRAFILYSNSLSCQPIDAATQKSYLKFRPQ